MLTKIDQYSESRKLQILSAPDAARGTGRAYYVCHDGDDALDGLSPDTAWQTLQKVNDAQLCPGDSVLFRRGDLFRGSFHAQEGVFYGAFGTGDKPRLYGWDYNLADETLWELYDAAHHIWKMTQPIPDCGTLVFDEGRLHSRKLIPSYIGGQFVCREDVQKPFVMAQEMTQNLDIFSRYDKKTTTTPSKGEDFPIPHLTDSDPGELYLRCDEGNPGKVFSSIEALPRRHMIRVKNNVHIDNLCLKYIGMHAISGNKHIQGLHVSNCEIGWIGGCIQHYRGTDPNYPEGKRGTVTRFGNGVEIYGGCEDYLVENCYIYQVYDAAITHQMTTGGKTYQMKNICYRGNLIENCVYGIEYFLDKTEGDQASLMENCEISGNILRLSGYGWGQQRHNTDTPALIKGWSFENTARNFCIRDNIFDRCAYRLVHLVAREKESCPVMQGNTYIQHRGGLLGQYGANALREPDLLIFDDHAEALIRTHLRDDAATVILLEKAE